MANRHVLYAATKPIEGPAASAAEYTYGKRPNGLVPYFVSGPLSRSGVVGFVGTILHVAAWVLALLFDLFLLGTIDGDKAPGAFTYWLWGFLTLMVGFVALVAVTIMHSLTNMKIPEGGAPPFLMTLFIGGAQISLTLTILQMIATLGYVPGGTGNEMIFFNTTGKTAGEMKSDLAAMRNLTVWTMICKVYIVQFLKNNQEWAGPANELKKQTVPPS